MAENVKGSSYLAADTCSRCWAPSSALRSPQPDATRAGLTARPGSASRARGRAAVKRHPHTRVPVSPESPDSGAHQGAEGCVRAGTFHWLSALTIGLIITGSSSADPNFEANRRLGMNLPRGRGSRRGAARPAGRRAASTQGACGQRPGAELPDPARRGKSACATPG